MELSDRSSQIPRGRTRRAGEGLGQEARYPSPRTTPKTMSAQAAARGERSARDLALKAQAAKDLGAEQGARSSAGFNVVPPWPARTSKRRIRSIRNNGSTGRPQRPKKRRPAQSFG